MTDTISKIIFAGLLILSFCTFARAEPPKPIENPEAYAEDIVRKLSQGRLEDVAKVVAETIGQSGQTDSIRNALQLFNGKRFDFSSQVIDNQFGNALRQIIHYAYVENLGFVYFRFNLKMTKQGWILAHFTYKSETQELFPKDFVDR